MNNINGTNRYAQMCIFDNQCHFSDARFKVFENTKMFKTMKNDKPK